MSKTRLIFNPVSDRHRSRRKVDALRAATERVGGLEWVQTERPGHAVELAERAALEGAHLVVAVGGDGTVHEVLNGLIRLPQEKRPAMGVVPLGSGNDFAFASRISTDARAALERALGGEPRPVDVARITDAAGRSRYFGNSAGLLFDAAVNIESHRIRRVHGFAMYLTATVRAMLRSFEPTHLKITTDGRVAEHDLLMLTLGNGPREGGGFMTTPQALNDDGELDCTMIRPVSRLIMVPMLLSVMRGAHGRSGRVSMSRFRTMKIEADRPVPVHLDGELWADYDADVRQLEVTILPAALQVIR